MNTEEEDEGRFPQGGSELSHSLWGGQLGLGRSSTSLLDSCENSPVDLCEDEHLSEGKAGAGILSGTSGWLSLS